MATISVIIPVHNAEKHLQQCLDSVCAQTFTDIEIICVDDASTDSSPALLAACAQKDSRVHILKQENLYAGIARNNGFKHSSGQYVVFWDADDYFHPQALEIMYERITQDQADICVCGASRYYENMGKEIPVNAYVMTDYLPEEIPFSRTSHEEYILNFTNEAAWNKLFRSDFIKEKQLKFQGVRNGNDLFFVACALCLAKRITITEDKLVCYRTMQTQSLVGTLKKSALTPFQAWIDVKYALERLDAFPKDSYIRQMAKVVFYHLKNIQDLKSFTEAVDFLKQKGLDELLLSDLQARDFYLADWHRAAIEQLIALDTDEFLMYLMALTQQQNATLIGQKALISHRCAILRERVSHLREQKARLILQRKELKAQLETSS